MSTETQTIKPTATRNAVVQFDGGCVPNPGERYGSWAVTLDNTEVERVSRKAFGPGTNNQAELIACERGVQALHAALGRGTIDPKSVRVTVLTDSVLVRDRLLLKTKTNPNNIPAMQLSAIAARIVKMLWMFGSYDAMYIPRARNVEAFGH